MPNHETNNVVVIGDPANIRAFVNEVLTDGGDNEPEKVIDFDRIIPRPANIETDGCPHSADDLGVGGTYVDETGNERICWYDWTRKHWGTKWGAYEHTHYGLRFLKKWNSDEVYGRVDLRFETAWNQPTPILEAIESRWGVTVHAITQDEGGAADVEYGAPCERGVLARTVSYEFESWDTEVPERLEAVA